MAIKNSNGDKLPDTQWHIGYAKMDENDHRRSKFRCVYFNDYICTNHGLRCDGMRCGGSSHCPGYADSEIIQERKREEEQYSYEDYLALRRIGLEDRKRRIAKSYHPICHRTVEYLEKCLVCNEIPVNVDGVIGLRRCPFCGMYYGNNGRVSYDPQVQAIIGKEPVFIMNRPKRKKPESQGLQIITRSENMKKCKYIRTNGKCDNTKEDLYGRMCDKQKCSWWQAKKVKSKGKTVM